MTPAKKTKARKKAAKKTPAKKTRAKKASARKASARKSPAKKASAKSASGKTTLAKTMKQLKALGTDQMRAFNAKRGVGDNQFGLKMGDIRAVAKAIKTNHELGLELWATGNIDAQFLAILVMQPKSLSADELDGLVRSVTFDHVANWLIRYVVNKHPDREALRQGWMTDDHPMAARAGWGQTAARVAKDPDGLNIKALLDRIEAEMGAAAPEVQWTMNCCLAEIGIHFAKHRKRALAIGEKLGVYRDYPTSKGCTSPFAPIWINEMVRRQG